MGSGRTAARSIGGRLWLRLLSAVVATIVLTQVVAVASGALLTEVAARRIAYVVVSVGVLAAATTWFLRRPDRPNAGPGPALLAASVALTWSVATVLLFI